MLCYVVSHLLICPACNISSVKILNKIVGTVTSLALLTVHKRIGKSSDMTGSYPSLRIHKDSTVKTDIILVFLNEFLEPSLLDIIFKLNAERAVVPCVCKTAVNFTACINKTSALTESNKLFH